jgi:hypothetical protein
MEQDKKFIKWINKVWFEECGLINAKMAGKIIGKDESTVRKSKEFTQFKYGEMKPLYSMREILTYAKNLGLLK